MWQVIIFYNIEKTFYYYDRYIVDRPDEFLAIIRRRYDKKLLDEISHLKWRKLK